MLRVCLELGDFLFAMPDAHQGYGFSIGGVAGFDLDKGIISLEVLVTILIAE
jgi:hypothetical protein